MLNRKAGNPKQGRPSFIIIVLENVLLHTLAYINNISYLFLNCVHITFAVMMDQFRGTFSNFQNIRNICESALSGVHVYKFSTRYLEKCPSFGVLKVENDHFSPYFRRFLHVSDFPNFSISAVQSVLGSFFAFLTKN